MTTLSFDKASLLYRAVNKSYRALDSAWCEGLFSLQKIISSRPLKPVLFCTQFYISNSKERQHEIDYCIESNSKLPWLSKMVLFCEADRSPPVSTNGKSISTQFINKRLTFKNVFEWAHLNYGHSDSIILLANSDILLPDNMPLVASYVKDNDFVALNRYEHSSDKLPFMVPTGVPGHPSITQDTWIFSAKLASRLHRNTLFDIPLGVLGCDNRIVSVLHGEGVMVSNPCFGIKTLHVHDSNVRTYKESERIYGGYGYPKTMTFAQFCRGRRISPLLLDRFA